MRRQDSRDECQEVRIRELAGWGLDEDEYRSAAYCGSPDAARALAAARSTVPSGPALLESDDSCLRERLAVQESRVDLRSEMAGLDWFLGLVDLRFLLAFQRRIVLDTREQESPMLASEDWDGLMGLCFAEGKPVACDAARSNASVLIRSTNPNLGFRITDDSANPISVSSGSTFFEVGHYRDRWFLRDGYHRAFRCLRAGIFRLPAVIVRARTLEELGAAQPWFFPEEVLFSSSPPRVIDFLDDALVIEYNRSPLIKTLRITVEETYSLQGEEV